MILLGVTIILLQLIIFILYEYLTMAKNLSEDEITKLFQYNITDINELDEAII